MGLRWLRHGTTRGAVRLREHNIEVHSSSHHASVPEKGGAPAREEPVLRVRYPLLMYFLLALLWFIILPPWQGPDEPGHFEYARLFSSLRRPPHMHDVDAYLEARILRSMDEHAFWRWTHQPRPSPLPDRFRDIPLLRRSGSQINDEAPLYYTVPALIFMALPDNLTLQLLVGRLYSLLLGALVIVIGRVGFSRRFSHAPHLAKAGLWLLALLPMPAFIHTTFNSNVLKDLLGALFFATAWLVLAPNRKNPRRAWGVFLIVTGLAGLGGLGSLVIPLALGLLLIVPDSPLRPWRRPVLVVMGAVLVAMLLFPYAPHRAHGWEQGPDRGPATRIPGVGVKQSAALFVEDASPRARAYVAQNLLAERVPKVWGKPLAVEARVRAVGAPAWVCLSIADDTAQTATCDRVGTAWQPLRVYHRARRGTPFVRVVIGVGAPRDRRATGAILVDDVSGRIVSAGSGLSEVLVNGDAETPAHRWAMLFSPLLQRLHLVPSYVYTPRQWQQPLKVRWILALGVLFTSFWGNYGWLVYPLPIPVYVLLAAVTLLSLLGWLRLGIGKRHGRAADLFDVLVIVFMVGGLLLPTMWTDWMPQGRYLFPLLLPIIATGIQGLDAWRPRMISPHVWWRLWIGGALLFHLYSLTRVAAAFPV